MPETLSDLKIIIRGAGEMATGTACRLFRSGFHRLIMTEIERPLAVRRTVSFSEALYEGTAIVEGIQAVRISSLDQAVKLWRERMIPVIVDPANTTKNVFKPDLIVDAILAKKNLGTAITDACLVVGLGPGFHAGKDVHYVVETNRGHDLGRLILDGPSKPNTGVPGDIAGHTTRRVLRAPREGIFETLSVIGTIVNEGDILGSVNGEQVLASIQGTLRGLVRSGTPVVRGFKIGDIDPRANPAYCHTISEKARAIGGAVLEALMIRFNQPQPDNLQQAPEPSG